MTKLKIEIADKLAELFAPKRGQLRYRVMRGGRGSGKSFSSAKIAAIWGAVESLRILCVREYQNSIKDSFHAELKNAIASDPWLATQYDVGVDYLRHKTNGTEFIFKGLRHGIESIKSLAQIDLCIAEEAETIPHTSWQALIPTIRAPKSEIWIIYNPRRRDSWVAEQFDQGQNPPRTQVAEVNHDDNPWFSRELEEQRQHDEGRMDAALYNHIWEGAYYEQSEAQVFANRYRVAEFEPQANWTRLQGLDFGFAADPTAGVGFWIGGNTLYIEYELYEKHLETDDMAAALMQAVPGIEKYATRADNARPETISYLQRHGLPKCVPCKKGRGSVEDGIAFIKSFDEIVIHPRCKNTIAEFDLYSYKTDRLSGEVLPVLIDANNHVIDAIRYGLEPVMHQTKKSFLTRRR